MDEDVGVGIDIGEDVLVPNMPHEESVAGNCRIAFSLPEFPLQPISDDQQPIIVSRVFGQSSEGIKEQGQILFRHKQSRIQQQYTLFDAEIL